jgi:hypothetical protein
MMATKHVTKQVTLTVKEWDTLGKACGAAAAKATPAAAKVLAFVRDLAAVAVDENSAK